MRVRAAFFCLLLVVFFSFSAMAATRLVTVAGIDAGDCTGAPCATINYAVGQAVDGDIIDVGPGTFNNGGANVNINKTLSVQGEQFGVDARGRGATETIITVPVLLSEDNVVFDGFTVTCGACTGIGAGIVMSASFSGYDVENNIVTGNPIGIYPGSNGATTSVIDFNEISENNVGLGVLAAAGTGIYTDNSVTNLLIDNNWIDGHQTANINIIGTSANKAYAVITNNRFLLDGVDDANALVMFDNDGTRFNRNEVSGGVASSIFFGGGNSNIQIHENLLDSSASSAIAISNFGPGPNGIIDISFNTIVDNLRAVNVTSAPTSPVLISFNRIEDNTTDLRTTVAGVTLNAENNWWGCNEGPATCAVFSIFAGSSADADPWLVMDIGASPSSITIAQTSNVTSDLLQNSDGAPVTGTFDFWPTIVAFSATNGTMTPPLDDLNGGAANSVFDPSVSGTATVSAALDDETVSTDIIVSPLTTTVTLTSDNNPSTFGENVTFTATLGDPTATGTIQFFEDGNPIGTVGVVGGAASLTTNTLPGGTHNVTAQYSGDGTFAPAGSNTVAQQVDPGASSVLLTSDNNPSGFGEDVTFTATLSNAGATGTVEFFEDGNSLGVVAVAGGVAQLTTNALPVGSHVVTAVYSGDGNNAAATSNPVTQVVTAFVAQHIPALSPMMLMLLAAMIAVAAAVALRR